MKNLSISNLEPPIYLSTNGKSSETAIEVANRFEELGVDAFELTSGKYIENPEFEIDKMIRKGKSVVLHNYFPPPKVPFVINLASNNSDILERSITQVKKSIRISSEIGAKVFAVHAGFLVDPNLEELGGKIEFSKLRDKKDALKVFEKSVRECAKFAKENRVNLLIENNVLTMENYQDNSQNPLLMTEPAEIREFMVSNADYVKILLDTGHLNVSAQTLGFDRIDALCDLREFIGGYQLSSNDGVSDQHFTFGESEWFLPYLDWQCSYITLEVDLSSTEKVLRNLTYLRIKREQSK